MLGSLLVYLGMTIAIAGLGLAVRPIPPAPGRHALARALHRGCRSASLRRGVVASGQGIADRSARQLSRSVHPTLAVSRTSRAASRRVARACFRGHQGREGRRHLAVPDVDLDPTRRAAVAGEHPECRRPRAHSRCRPARGFCAARRPASSRARDWNSGRRAARHERQADARSVSETVAGWVCTRHDELHRRADRSAGVARVDRDAGLRQQPRRAPTVCGVLAGHLPRQRAHPAHVASGDRATCNRPNGSTLIAAA